MNEVLQLLVATAATTERRSDCSAQRSPVIAKLSEKRIGPFLYLVRVSKRVRGQTLRGPEAGCSKFGLDVVNLSTRRLPSAIDYGREAWNARFLY